MKKIPEYKKIPFKWGWSLGKNIYLNKVSKGGEFVEKKYWKQKKIKQTNPPVRH